MTVIQLILQEAGIGKEYYLHLFKLQSVNWHMVFEYAELEVLSFAIQQ